LVTVLTDGDAGLRTIHRELAPQAEHVLDWFHVSMKFQNLKQLAKGINATADGAVRAHALAQLERAKWRFWNGYTKRASPALYTSNTGRGLNASSIFSHSERWPARFSI
jgi:hypothetical protein